MRKAKRAKSKLKLCVCFCICLRRIPAESRHRQAEPAKLPPGYVATSQQVVPLLLPLKGDSTVDALNLTCVLARHRRVNA